MSELERVNQDPEFREYMSAEEDNRKIQNSLRIQAMKEGREEGRTEGIQQGIQQGIEQGIEQGSYQSKIEIAKSLLENHVDIEIIAKSTGLEIEKIKEL